MSLETMTKLQTVTVGAGGSATVSFTNIPQGYTDLKVIFSAQGTRASDFDGIYLSFNGSTDNFTGKYSQAITPSTPTSGSIGRYVGAFPAANLTSKFGSAELYVSDYASNNLKMYSVDAVTGGYTSNQALLEFINGVWSNASPITSISFAFLLGNFAQHSTVTMYGVKNAAKTAGNSIKATGGNIAFDGTYVTHTFFSTGTFTPTQSLTCDYLVVAGGGGGSFGGGGAGGFRTSIGSSPLSVNTGSSYSVLVGAGGTGGTGSGTAATNGSDSSFSTITSTGGGYGGGQSNNTGAGNSGGSGGGASHGTGSSGATTTNFGAGNAGGYTPVEGYAGGTGKENPHYTGGGGGGSSAAGGNSTNSVGGNGGAGTASSISGTSVTYAGGGGGSYASTGAAGGGNAASTSFGNGSSATANTGSGGGGANRTETRFSGAGGSGIVIIRYKG
jgi:hypothetical protein